MNKIKLLGLVLLFATIVNSQSYDGKGDKKLNVGFDLYGYGNGISATFDYGLSDLFSIGLGGSYYLSNDDNSYYVFARTAVHLGGILDFNEKFDVYPGLALGYLQRNDVGFSAYLGLRYFFTESIGAFAELGNNGSIGISFTF